ncbi:hypothetical protein, partial [Paracoccus aerius]
PIICASVKRLFLISSAPSGCADSTSQRGNFRGAGHIGTALGLAPEKIDDLFRQAATITA